MNIIHQTSNISPEAIFIIDANNYYYNYDILTSYIDIPSAVNNNENTTEDMDPILLGEDALTEVLYSYISLKMSGIPNYNDIVKAIIRVHISAEEEFDLINSYNRSIIFKEINDNVKYIKYLQLLENIKLEVRKSLDSYNAIHDTHY